MNPTPLAITSGGQDDEGVAVRVVSVHHASALASLLCSLTLQIHSEVHSRNYVESNAMRPSDRLVDPGGIHQMNARAMDEHRRVPRHSRVAMSSREGILIRTRHTLPGVSLLGAVATNGNTAAWSGSGGVTSLTSKHRARCPPRDDSPVRV